MQSRTSYFNGTLFRKNLTRFWPLWAGASFLGALIPLAGFLEVFRRGSTIDSALEMTELYYSAVSYAVPIVSLCYALLCAMTVWSYLFNARSVGLYHALPLRREGLFVTNFLSGMAMMLIPYVVTGTLCILLSVLCEAFDPVGTGVTILAILGESFFYFATATAVAFLTGHAFAMPVLYFLFHFLSMLMEFLIDLLAELFLFGVTGSYGGVLAFLSPTWYLMTRLGVDGEYQTVTVPGVTGTKSELVAVSLKNPQLIALYALAGLVFVAIAWILYRQRSSESAGDLAAAGWMKPVYRYGISALAGIAGGMVLYAIFFEEYEITVNTPGVALCMIVAGLIGYMIASMLLAKSLRVFHRKNLPGAVAVAAAAVLLCVCLRLDLLGISTRVPETDDIESLTFYCSSNHYTLTPERDGALTEQVLELHRAIVADREYAQSGLRTLESTSERTGIYCYIEYTLRNGTTLYREYSLPITRERLEQSGTYDQLLDVLVNGPEAKSARLHLNDPELTVSGGNFYNEAAEYVNEGVYEDSYADREVVAESWYDLNIRQAQALLEAVGRDADAGHWGTVDWFDSSNRDVYAASLELNFRRGASADTRWSDTITIQLTPEMTETLDCLEELQITTRAQLRTYGELNPDGYDDAYDEDDVGVETAALELSETAAA